MVGNGVQFLVYSLCADIWLISAIVLEPLEFVLPNNETNSGRLGFTQVDEGQTSNVKR